MTGARISSNSVADSPASNVAANASETATSALLPPTRRDFLFGAAAAVLAGCGQREHEPSMPLRQGPTLETSRINQYATDLQAALSKQGHIVTSSIPESASQLFVVVRYVHAPHSIEIADPNKEGQALLEQISSSTVQALRTSLRSLGINQLYADGMTEGGVAYFDRYMRLSDKQRSPQKIDQELASFMEVREQVENDASIAPNKRQEALLLVDRSVQDWTQLKEAAADFHQKAKTGPMYALALERAAVPLVSEDPALHARVLSETLANANTASPQTANTPEQSGENLATLIRSGLKLALAANKDEAELFGSAGLATLQNQRESWLLASATNTRAISIVLMGAGHSFGDNISALGLSSRVGLIEVIPKKVMEIANS